MTAEEGKTNESALNFEHIIYEKKDSVAKIIGFILKCDRCGGKFTYEFNTPLAVSCVHCSSVFDARMQIFRQARAEVDKITSL